MKSNALDPLARPKKQLPIILNFHAVEAMLRPDDAPDIGPGPDPRKTRPISGCQVKMTR